MMVEGLHKGVSETLKIGVPKPSVDDGGVFAKRRVVDEGVG